MALRRSVVLALAMAVAGCSRGAAPATPPAGTELPAVFTAPTTTGPAASGGLPSASSSATGSVPGASAVTGSQPSPAATQAAEPGGWRTVLEPLVVPKAYLDFGFAGNGDLLVVGTDDLVARPLRAWIARYAPDGTQKSKVDVDHRMTYMSGDWIDVDPAHDDVLFQQLDTSTYDVYRVASTNGNTLAQLNLHRAVTRVAVDAKGRVFGVSATYATRNSKRPCVLDRIGSAGGIAEGVDYELETCEEYVDPTFHPYFESPISIDVDAAGRLVFSDEREGGGIGLNIVTTGFEFVRHWDLDSELQQLDPAYGGWLYSWFITGATDGRICLGETMISDDGTRSVGNRVRCFGPAGELLATYGYGGEKAGVTTPQAPRVDSAGRLWVIDLDPTTRSFTIKVREALT